MTFVNIKIGDNGRYDSYLSIKFIETKFSQDKYLILAKYIYDEDGFIRAYWDLSLFMHFFRLFKNIKVFDTVLILYNKNR